KGSDPGLRRGEPRRFPFRGPLARRLRCRWTLEEIGIGRSLTLLLRKPIHCFRGLRPEGHRPLPRWPRIETFFRRRKSVPHRETRPCRANPIRAKANRAIPPVDNGDIGGKYVQKSK